MGIIGWIFFGLIVGIVGKFLMPGRDPGGWVVTILLGIGGALIGGFVGQALGFYREGEPAGFIMAVLGSILLLVIYRMFAGKRTISDRTY
ncbi:MAG TPA: GlsB/YeaQ/YmgE family stress response membrane protein [Candidatus Limnocylindria bacterium]|nr:GlsB/YeaQ/YmgE family stress response membrane protein [Candidatus Limnocylindria bacterium]